MRRAVWLTLAVAVNAILTTVSLAQTNSCISSNDGFWDEARIWSLNKPPSIRQSAILITNDASETVTIDSTTAHHFKSTLTISNLDISAPYGSTDTVYLADTGTTALHIIDGLVIGIAPGNPSPGGGLLISSNSTLIVDGVTGGQFQDDGAVVITGGSLITTNCSLQVAAESSTMYGPSGFLSVSNAIVQARDVALGTASEFGSSGTVELHGGTMTVSSSLTLGLSEKNGGGIGSLLVADGGELVVTNGSTSITRGSITVENADFLGGSVSLNGLLGADLIINNGTVNLNGQIDIGTGDQSVGGVSLNGGLLVVTNDIITMGGDFTGGGNFTVSDGIFLGQTMFLSLGRLSIQSGTSILSSNLDVGFGGSVYIGGGQLFVTNAPMTLFSGNSQCIVTGGLLAANNIVLSSDNYGGGTLSVNGGSVTASTGITVGNCASNVLGHLFVDGGQAIVTNAAHTAFIDVRNGQLVLSNGVLQVDKLVMTNSCSSFVHTGGTLIAGSVVLDSNAFQITSVAREGNDLRVTWLMAPGSTNALQVSTGGSHGRYVTNNFKDIFIVTNNTTAGTLTNYLDIGGATNTPSRYYRARLSP
jgi:hypothetical protein